MKPTSQDETHDGRFQPKKPTAEEIEKAARKCASEVLGFEPNEVRPDDTIIFYAGAIWSEAHAKNSSEEAYYTIKEAIQVMEHYDTGEDFAIVSSLRRMREFVMDFEKGTYEKHT